MELGEVARFRPRVRGRLGQALVVTALWMVVVATSVDLPRWPRIAAFLILLPSVAFRWLVVAGVARQPWAVEIGPDGVRSCQDACWRGPVRTRPDGSWINLDQVAATAGRLVAAVQRFSNLPVVGWSAGTGAPGARAASRFGSTNA